MLLPKAAHGACEQLYLGGTPGQRILAHGGHPVGVQSIGHFHPGGKYPRLSASHPSRAAQSLCLPCMAASMVSRAVPGAAVRPGTAHCKPRIPGSAPH